MKTSFPDLKKTLESCFKEQVYYTAFWHEQPPTASPANAEDRNPGSLNELVLIQHYYNFRLWHVEDEARRTDVDDTVIAGCKRRIDGLNQKRNDAIEVFDRRLFELLEPLLPETPCPRHNTETVGMAVDRLSILALKMYHMEEQTRRDDVSAEHIRSCHGKLEVLQRQRIDLARAVSELIDDYAAGARAPLLYSQFKMYNDPSLNPALYGKKQTQPDRADKHKSNFKVKLF